MIIEPGKRTGAVQAPRSKSHEHRLLIADFLAGDDRRLAVAVGDADDIIATKRCLQALRSKDPEPVLDCGESGSTRRFLAPIAAALGKRAIFKTAGRLASRPQQDYASLRPGEFQLEGNVSSQFVTGLLFALPLLAGNSSIRFLSPLQSRGYVEMTLKVLRSVGIRLFEDAGGFVIPGNQRYVPQPQIAVEGDWSGAAFWYGMNALGSHITIDGLAKDSAQPDRAVAELVRIITIGGRGNRSVVEVSGCPDLFPVLSVVAGGSLGDTLFTGTRRLRLKESDRIAAMVEVLSRFGVRTRVEEDSFLVYGMGGNFNGGQFRSFGDHRIAMSIAVGATCAREAVEIDDVACASKSYPDFFTEFARMRRD